MKISEAAKRIYDAVNCHHAKNYDLNAEILLPRIQELIDSETRELKEALKEARTEFIKIRSDLDSVQNHYAMMAFERACEEIKILDAALSKAGAE